MGDDSCIDSFKCSLSVPVNLVVTTLYFFPLLFDYQPLGVPTFVKFPGRLLHN